MEHPAVILVSGLPGAGKSTFARWLGKRLCAPVVSYDRIGERILEALGRAGLTGEALAKAGALPYEMFLFEMEEHMGSLFIADYIFSTKQRDWLEERTKSHGTRAMNVHFAIDTQKGYERYRAREAQETGRKIRREVSLEEYAACTAQNRDFRFGDRVLEVDAGDFSQVDYEEIYREVADFLGR